MLVPSFSEMTRLCLGVGTIQLVTALRFYFRVRADLRNSEILPAVPVSVIMPCKGSVEGLEENVGALVGQDYPAGAEFIFVAPSRNDPAYLRLRDILGKFPGAKTKLLSSEAVPSRCSEQVLNMLCGVENASAGTDALVFVDSDLKVVPSWLANMTAPLSDPAVGVTTTPLLFLPSAWNICANLRCVWEALGIQYLDMMGCVVGHSFAISKKNFLGLGVGDVWKRSLNNDLSLTGRVRKAGLKVRFVYRALPTSAESCDPRRLLTMLNKWMLHFKFYFPLVWVMGALLTAFKLYAVFWSARYNSWRPLGILLGLDILHIFATLCILRACFGGRFKDRSEPFVGTFLFISALTAPLLQLTYAVNFANSFFTNRVRWGGYTYRINGPYDITVEPGTAAR